MIEWLGVDAPRKPVRWFRRETTRTHLRWEVHDPPRWSSGGRRPSTRTIVAYPVLMTGIRPDVQYGHDHSGARVPIATCLTARVWAEVREDYDDHLVTYVEVDVTEEEAVSAGWAPTPELPPEWEHPRPKELPEGAI